MRGRGLGTQNRFGKEIHEHFPRQIERNPDTLPGQEGQTSLIILSGLPGSGKSTLARQVWPDARLVCPDEYRAKAPNSAGEWDQAASGWAFPNAHEDTKAFLQEGNIVVFDSLAANERSRKDLVKIAQSAGVPVHYVLLDRGMKAAMEANVQRGLINPMREVSEHVFGRVYDSLIKNPEHLLQEGYSQMAIITDPSKYGVTPLAPKIKLRSSEDRAQLANLLASDDAPAMLDQMRDDGRLERLMPGVFAGVGFDQQTPYHNLTLYEHTRAVFAAMCERTDDPVLRMAALVHDIGKPESKWLQERPVLDENKKPVKDEDGNDVTRMQGRYFYDRRYYARAGHPAEGKEGHESIGARMAMPIGVEYGFDPADTRRFVTLTHQHMVTDFNQAEQVKAKSNDPEKIEVAYQKAAHQILRKINYDLQTAQELMLLHECDRHGKAAAPGPKEMAELNQRRAALVQGIADGPLVPASAKVKVKLAVAGSELRDKFDLKGSQIGDMVKHLTGIVDKDPHLNSRSELLRQAQRFANQR